MTLPVSMSLAHRFFGHKDGVFVLGCERAPNIMAKRENIFAMPTTRVQHPSLRYFNLSPFQSNEELSSIAILF
jgi:hypothetical protein